MQDLKSLLKTCVSTFQIFITLRLEKLEDTITQLEITREFIRMMQGWRHSGSNVFCGERIYPHQKRSIERLAAYLIRASFSQERIDYLPEEAMVIYHSKDGKEKKTYDALGTHVPLRGKQMVRYYAEPIP